MAQDPGNLEPRMVQMWFKLHGNNFHVAGTKTDLDSLRRDLRKLAQAHIKGTKNGENRQECTVFVSSQKKRITAD